MMSSRALAPATTATLLALALAVPLQAARAAGDVAAGKEKVQQCAVCHGIDGIAKRPDAPNLAGESDFYIIKQLKAFRSGARQHEIMTIIAGGLNDEDIADLAAWYSHIKVTVELPDVGGQN